MAVVTSGLLKYWNAKDGIKNTDKLANLAPAQGAHDVTVVGGTYNAPGGYIDLDGIDDQIILSAIAAFQTQSAYTFEYIHYLNATIASSYSELYAGGAYADYSANGSGYVEYYAGDYANYEFITFPSTANANTIGMHHLVIRYNGTNLSIFLNGTKYADVAIGTGKHFAGTGIDTITFNSNVYSEPFPLRFHAVRFYDRALSDAEVAQNYANGTEIGLTAAPVEVTGAASLAANASAAQSALKIQTAAASMATGGTLAASARKLQTATAAMSGSGATTAQGLREQSGIAAMAATGITTSSGSLLRLGSTALIATAQTSAAASTVTGVIAGATIGSISTIGTTSVRVTDAGASMNGAALLTTTAVAIIEVTAEATLAGASSSAQSAIATRNGTAPLSAESSAAASGETVFSAAVEMTVATSTTATPEVGFEAASTLAAAAEIESQPIVHREDGATMAGASTLDVNAISGTEVSAVIAAQSSGSASALRIQTGASASVASGVIVASSTATREDTAQLTASADILAGAVRTQTFGATLAGAGGSLQDGIRIVTTQSHINADGTIETTAAAAYTASASPGSAAYLSATSDSTAVVLMSAELIVGGNLNAASQKATSGTTLLDISTGLSTTGVRTSSADSELAASSATDAAEPVRLAIVAADMDSVAQAVAIASAIKSVEVTASGSADLATVFESTKNAAAELLASASLDVDYAPGYYTTAHAYGTADTRDTIPTTVERARATGSLIKTVRAYGVITRREGV